MAQAGLNLGQLAANEQTRQLRYSGAPVDNLPGLAEDVRRRVKVNLVRELRNVKAWAGVVNAPDGLRLRAQPSTAAAILDNLTNQTLLDVLNEDDPQSEWILVATDAGAAGFVARAFVARSAQPAPVVTTGLAPVPAGLFRHDPELASLPMAPNALDQINLGASAGEGARRLANTWNRYGGLLTALASRLGLDPAVAVAVLMVESGGVGFENGRLIIRFENHLFFEEWGVNHQAVFFQHFTFNSPRSWEGHTWRSDPNLPAREFHGNQDAEWQVLNFAANLDDSVAKRSISMGAPQILGRNHARIGYSNVQQMFEAFGRDERAHLLGLFDFIQTDSRMVQALRRGDYLTFATHYNGPGNPQFYADRIAEVLRAFSQLRTVPAMAAFGPGGGPEVALDAQLDAGIAFLPIPEAPGVLVEVKPPTETQPATPGAAREPDPQLLDAWRRHVEQGLANNNIMFRRVLNAFMLPYYLTVAMYVLLFLVGVGLFIFSASLATQQGKDVTALVFGGLGVVTFLAFFVSKPLRSLEENLQYITWLGIVYNSYWTRLLYLQDPITVHNDLKDATSQAELSIGKLIDKNTELSKERPGFSVR